MKLIILLFYQLELNLYFCYFVELENTEYLVINCGGIFLKNHLGKILLIIIPIIVAIFTLLPTYNANQLETKRKEYVEKAKNAETPADSLAILDEFAKLYGKDLYSAKSNQLKLGLDLRGGMYVTLEVDVVKLIEETALKTSLDETFNQVLDATRKESADSEEDIVDIFVKNFNTIARAKNKTLIKYFPISDINDNPEERIVEKLRADAEDAINQAQEVIRQRIDQYGVAEPNIQKIGSRRIILELPGVQNRDQMLELLKSTARLEFNLVKNSNAVAKAFYNIDKELARQAKLKKGDISNLATDSSTVVAGDTSKADTTKVVAVTPTDSTKVDSTKADSASVAKADTTDPYAGMSQEDASKAYMADHPFTTHFITEFYQEGGTKRDIVYYVNDQLPDGEYNFTIAKSSIPKVKEILRRPEIAKRLPAGIKFAFDAKPREIKTKDGIDSVYMFYAITSEPLLTGEVLTEAMQSFRPEDNSPVVNMTMNSEGANKWAKITDENKGNRIAIVLDDLIYSAPVVRDRITGGRSEISGMANVEEARLLEIILKAGALKAPVQIIEERIVGPSLGEDSINAGLTASLFGALLVVLYMGLYYKKAGLIADLAVIMNVLLILTTLAALKGTLTLPGIAGIILTIGMAVDANVLIFERIREELALGRSLRSAIDEGYKRAMTAIIDSNITTAFTALILLLLGTGPIKGFATTLLIGIIFTLFTAITITRAVVEIMISNKASEFDFGQPKFVSSTK